MSGNKIICAILKYKDGLYKLAKLKTDKKTVAFFHTHSNLTCPGVKSNDTQTAITQMNLHTHTHIRTLLKQLSSEVVTSNPVSTQGTSNPVTHSRIHTHAPNSLKQNVHYTSKILDQNNKQDHIIITNPKTNKIIHLYKTF